jgi:hypothetical protein
VHPAVENLYVAKEILDELGLTFWLTAGTLLLAYRDQRVDETDIDISVYDIQTVIKNLDKFYDKGFVLKRHYTNGTGLADQLTLERNNIDFDIWTKEFRDGQAWWCSYSNVPIPHHVDERHYKTLDTIEIWGETWNVPSDTEKFLEACYGDWRTPNPDWRWWCDPVCIDYDWDIK